MLLVVDDPDHVDDFIRYIKTESAHAVNKLWGRKKRTVWCDGYDSPMVITPKDAMKYIEYIYTNPLSSKRSIRSFRGVSSFWMYAKGVLTRQCFFIRRFSIPALANDIPTLEEQKKILSALRKKIAGKCQFKLEPDAWMDCYPELKNVNKHVLNREILDAIRKKEEAVLSKTSSAQNAPDIPSKEKIRTYLPDKFSKRMICLCSDIEIRIQFILWYRTLVEEAKKAFERVKRGLSASYPPGFFAPGGYMCSNMLPEAIPV
jgi:hypothetical protein